MHVNIYKVIKKLGIVLMVGLISASLIAAVGFVSNKASVNWERLAYLLDLDNLGKELLIQGLPGLAQYEVKDVSDIDSPGELIQQALSSFSMTGLGDPKALLNSQMSYLQLAGAIRDKPLTQEEIIFFERDYTVDDMIPREETEEREQNDSLVRPAIRSNGESLVAIYNSHNGETYTPEDGVPRIDGINGGVVKVAEMLAKALEEKHGIPTVRSEKIHDYPSYALSYANSLKTVEEILKKHPSVEIVIDVHRDYQPTRAQTTVAINGQQAAKILFIVGNDARQTHPRWRQNLAFVTSLEKKMNEMYPGLSRGVRQQDGRYNQHLHPKAILVEMGSAENSLAEAIRSAEMLADVIARILLEIQQQQKNL
ncbi:MAG: stage II sporulation protein P [Clostridia bacterium]|nr:stage II sporulation protein P [Clostridia bacterium]